MENITLARAFKIRSQLKKKVSELQSAYYSVEKYWDKSQRPIFNTGESPEELSQAILDTQNFIFLLSVAINNANKEKAQDLLLSINYTNDVLRHLTQVQNDMSVRLKPTKEINPVTGIETVTEYEVAQVKPDIKEALKNSKNYKNLFEDQLATINATTEIVLTDILQEKIKNLEL
jgi:hypothetical protein